MQAMMMSSRVHTQPFLVLRIRPLASLAGSAGQAVSMSVLRSAAEFRKGILLTRKGILFTSSMLHTQKGVQVRGHDTRPLRRTRKLYHHRPKYRRGVDAKMKSGFWVLLAFTLVVMLFAGVAEGKESRKRKEVAVRRAKPGSRRNSCVCGACGGGACGGPPPTSAPPPPPPPPPPATDCSACGINQYLVSECTEEKDRVCESCFTLVGCGAGQRRSGCEGVSQGACVSCDSCLAGHGRSGCSGLCAGTA